MEIQYYTAVAFNRAVTRRDLVFGPIFSLEAAIKTANDYNQTLVRIANNSWQWLTCRGEWRAM